MDAVDQHQDADAISRQLAERVGQAPRRACRFSGWRPPRGHSSASRGRGRGSRPSRGGYRPAPNAPPSARRRALRGRPGPVRSWARRRPSTRRPWRSAACGGRPGRRPRRGRRWRRRGSAGGRTPSRTSRRPAPGRTAVAALGSGAGGRSSGGRYSTGKVRVRSRPASSRATTLTWCGPGVSARLAGASKSGPCGLASLWGWPSTRKRTEPRARRPPGRSSVRAVARTARRPERTTKGRSEGKAGSITSTFGGDWSATRAGASRRPGGTRASATAGSAESIRASSTAGLRNSASYLSMANESVGAPTSNPPPGFAPLRCQRRNLRSPRIEVS